MKRRYVVLAAAAGIIAALVPTAPASAHPLGNFSVNQYLGLTVRADALAATAVVDYAEIPTLQDRPAVDTSHDGTVSPAELSAYAAATCSAYAGAVSAQAGGDHLVWTVTSSWFAYSPGAGGLEVSRLSCGLSAPASLGHDTTLSVSNGYLVERVGWREMTAVGDGVGLVDSPLPDRSVSDELRAYPQDLLSSTLDVRSAMLRVTPGAGTGPAALAPLGGSDPVSRWMSTVDRKFQDLAGGDLTPLVGLLAVALAILLGAGHAALPGHGKTVLAAYLAGKRGRPRDALAVAGTVTATHTGGVLILGLVLTAGTALAGEAILGWLGLVSGFVVVAVGVSMLVAVIRRRHPHSHDHDGSHGHDHHHDHGHHDHGHHHDHSGHTHDGHTQDGHTHDGHAHDEDSHDHGHAHEGHHHHHHHAKRDRFSLAGIGLAGGLVPSPSALVVLLAAIGLGRTAFGILLVVAYGVGMAATLTGAGLLLVVLQRRLTRAAARSRRTGMAQRFSAIAARVNAATPAATAALVLVVGAGLAARAATTILV